MVNSLKKLDPGLDTRGNAGYAVAVGSVPQSGRVYAYADPQIRPAQMPEWLQAELQGADGPKIRNKGGPLQAILEGTRNETLFREACKLRGQGKTEAEICTAIATRNEEHCQPPLSTEEVGGIAKNVACYPAGNMARRANERNQFWWFQLNANEYCTDIRMQLLTDYQFGWLMWLRIFAWTHCGYLPNHPGALAKLARASDPEQFADEMFTVLSFFEMTEDQTRIYDPELVAYWAEKVAVSEANSKAGRASAAKHQNSSAGQREIPKEN